MANKPNIPKGTRDFSPLEMAKRNYIFNTIKEVYALYGFQQSCVTLTPYHGNVLNVGDAIMRIFLFEKSH